MKELVKCSWAFALILTVAAAACQSTGQEKVTPVASVSEVFIVLPSISDAEIFAKAQRDWVWNNALHRAILVVAGRVESGYGEDRVVFNGTEHTVDVMGMQYSMDVMGMQNQGKGDEFNIIIDDRCPTKIWVIVGPQKVDIMVPNVNVPYTLTEADEETKKTARAVIALWVK